MSLDDPAVLVGVFTVLLGLFSAANSITVTKIERNLARRSRAADLYNEYYSPENYRRIVLPVIRLHLKWCALPEAHRDAYRKAVRRGWLGFDSEPERLLRAYVSTDRLLDDVEEAHFRDTLPSTAFTEHEALTVFLYFWTKVFEMLQGKIIDRRTTERLLRRPYLYVCGFIAELREEIEGCAGPRELPVWVEATRELDRFFGVDEGLSAAPGGRAAPRGRVAAVASEA